jgi:WD40 repeat protein
VAGIDSMRVGIMTLAVVLYGPACGCPRHGEPPVATTPADTNDADAAPLPPPPDASPSIDAPVETPPPPLDPLPEAARPVPQLGHAGPVWAVPLQDGTLGIDAQGFGKWWTFPAADAPARLLRSAHLGTRGLTAVAFGGPGAHRTVALGTATGSVFLWQVPAPGTEPVVLQPIASGLPRAVTAVAVSASGRRVAAGTADGTVRLFGDDGAIVWIRDRDHADTILDLAFSPDGARVAGACADGVVSVWNAVTGTRLQPLPHDGPVHCVAWSPDGLMLAVGTAMHSLQLWSGDLLTAATLRSGFPDGIDRLVFASANRLVAADERGRIWDLSLPTLAGTPPADGEGRLRSLSLDERGRGVAGGEDGGVRLLDVAEGRRRASAPAAVVPMAVAASPDGRLVSVGLSDGAIVRLDAATGRELQRVAAHGDAVTALAWTAGDALVTASLDGTLRLWRGDGREPAGTWNDQRNPLTALAASPDGARLATGGADGSLLVWNIADGEPSFAASLSGHASRVLALAFSRDGAFVWSVGLDRIVLKWSVERRRWAWDRPAFVRTAATRVVALSGGRALVGLADGGLAWVGPTRSAARLAPRCDGPVQAMAAIGDADGEVLVVCADGALRRLAPAGADGLPAWDGEPLRPENDAVSAFAPDPAGGGTIYACGEGVRALELADGRTRWSTFFAPGGSATFSALGRYVLTGEAKKLIAYGDGRTVHGLEDPAVGGRAETAGGGP